MARCTTLLICLLLSLSAGFGTYMLGAVTWCVIDPQGAGAKLLFTIPVALAGMAVPGIIAMLCWAFRCEFISEPKASTKTSSAPALLRPPRTPRPATATPADEDLEFALAT